MSSRREEKLDLGDVDGHHVPHAIFRNDTKVNRSSASSLNL